MRQFSKIRSHIKQLHYQATDNVTYPLPNTKGILLNNNTIANALAKPDRNPNIPIDKIYLDT